MDSVHDKTCPFFPFLSFFSVVSLAVCLFRLGPIASNSLHITAVYVARLMIQLALLFLLARYLGPGAYGEYAAIVALAAGLGTLSSFGVGFVVLAESARSPQAAQAALAQAVPATLLSAALLLPLYWWFSRDVLGSTASLVSLGVIGTTELLVMPLLTLLSQRLQGLGYVLRSQAMALLPMLLRLAGVVVCIALFSDNRLEMYALVYALASSAGLLLALCVGAELAKLPHRLNRPQMQMLRNGSRYAAMSFTAMNPAEIDKALALRLLGANDAGLYALASRGMAVVTLPVSAMVVAALPRLLRDAASSPSRASRLIVIMMAVAIAYGLAAAALLYLAAPPLLEWALGAYYAGIGEVVAKLALIALFMTSRHASGTILFALGRPMLRTGIESVALVLLVLLALLLGPRLGLNGLIAAVLASEASMAVFAGLYLWRYVQRPLPLANAATPMIADARE